MNVFNVCGIVLFLGVVSLSGATITPEERHKTDYTTNWTPNETQTYTVSATASGCSFADSKTQASSGATLSSHSSSGASAEKKVTHNDVPNTSAFSFSVFGVLAGSGKGPEVSWSAALQQKFFWLTPLQKIVAEGTEVTVSANGTPTEATWNIGSREWKDWTVSGGKPYKVSSITLNRNMWDKMQWTPSPVPENWKCPTAGVYHINAATTEESVRSAQAIVRVVNITKPAKNGNSEKWDNVAKKYDSQVIKGDHLEITGYWAGASGGTWNVTKGTLAKKNNSSTSFSYTSAEKGISLGLYFTETETVAVDSRNIDVYEDYLELGRENFGVGDLCINGWKPQGKYGVSQDALPAQDNWNCHGSTAYFASGNTGGNTQTLPNYSVQEERIAPDDAYWSSLVLYRGDIVAFYSGGTTSNPLILQHSHTSMGGNTMYGANNEPVINSPGVHPATWKWYECTSKNYYNAVNSSWLGPNFLTKIRILRK